MTAPTTGFVDFTVMNGEIRKRLHSANYAPSLYPRLIHDDTPEFKELHLTEARTHDWALTNPGQRIIDTHFIFPNLKADPSDPDNYYFAASDEIIDHCISSGTEVYYRLGTSIEHTVGKHFNTVMPDDFERYAEVLAGIVRHYVRGWAAGCTRNIRYWEIWNEPDIGAQMWTGSMEKFEEFFIVVLKRLKREFPELKIGGPAFCWLNEELLHSLLTRCQAAGVKPDFISWHNYGHDPDYLISLPGRARELLDTYGFTDTELHINEWHYIIGWEGLHSNITEESFHRHIISREGVHGIDSAAYNLTVLCGWHDTPLTAAYYYGTGGTGNWGFRNLYRQLSKNFYSLKLFGILVSEFKKRVAATSKVASQTLFGVLSDDGQKAGVLFTDYRGDGVDIVIEVKGMEGRVAKGVILDHDHNLTSVPVTWEGGKLTLRKNEPGSVVFWVTFEK